MVQKEDGTPNAPELGAVTLRVRARVSKFIEAERGRFGDRNNDFAFTFAEIEIYLEYLEWLLIDIDVLGREFVDSAQRWMKGPPGTRTLTPEEVRQRQLDASRQRRLHMYEEAVFLFANILLARVAAAVEFYFGPARECSFKSHRTLRKSFVRFASLKGLSGVPNGLLEKIEECRRLIGQIRDYAITHRREPGLGWGTMWDAEGKTQLFDPLVRPGEDESRFKPPIARETVELVSAYVLAMLEYIEANRDKAKT